MNTRESTWFSDGQGKHFTLSPRPNGLEWAPTETPLTLNSAREVREWDDETKSVMSTFNAVETTSDDAVTSPPKTSKVKVSKKGKKNQPIGSVSFPGRGDNMSNVCSTPIRSDVPIKEAADDAPTAVEASTSSYLAKN